MSENGNSDLSNHLGRRKPKQAKKFSEYHRKLLFSTDSKSLFVKAVFENIKHGNGDNVKELVNLLRENGQENLLLRREQEEETVLHAAVKVHTPVDVIEVMVDACPDLLLEARVGSTVYRGQTALHIAITDENIEMVDLILRRAQSLEPKQRSILLHKIANGKRFEDTVMMGQLPLSVATLTLNQRMVDLLLSHQAEIDRQNSHGDNVCHSLIRYASLYPEKIDEVMKMLEHLCKRSVSQSTMRKEAKKLPENGYHELEKENVHIWQMENVDDLNPLQLSASLGQQKMFKFIMDLKGVYCLTNSEDGLFDVNVYDVTEMDAISVMTNRRVSPVGEKTEEMQASGIYVESGNKTATNKSVLEMILGNEPLVVFQFIQYTPLRYIINRKWGFYRWFYILWGLIHVAFMVGFTVYAARRAERSFQNTTVYSFPADYKNKVGEDSFVTAYLVLSLVFAVCYILQEIVRCIRGRMPWTIRHFANFYHNGPFRILLSVFSLSIIADVIWKTTDSYYSDYFLVLSLITGWWFIVFFLRAFRQFSFFTVMIQKVLVGDMFRFAIIISMELVAFTTAMYIAFQGSRKGQDVEEYGPLMHYLFKMMFGFTTIEILFDAPTPWFAVTIYTAFVLLTYVLMINCLIAMMANTCALVSKDRDIQWRVQQLSVILFFESIFPACCLRIIGEPRRVGWFHSDLKQYVERRRYFLEVRSLHNERRQRLRSKVSTHSMLESIFFTLKELSVPGFSTWEEEPNTIHERPRTAEDVSEKPEVVEREPKSRKPKKKKKKQKSVNVIETDEEGTKEKNRPNDGNDAAVNDAAVQPAIMPYHGIYPGSVFVPGHGYHLTGNYPHPNVPGFTPMEVPRPVSSLTAPSVVEIHHYSPGAARHPPPRVKEDDGMKEDDDERENEEDV